MPSEPTNCAFCQGSGLCHCCDGTGFIRARRARLSPCHECDNTGKCALCKGTGLREAAGAGGARKEREGE